MSSQPASPSLDDMRRQARELHAAGRLPEAIASYLRAAVLRPAFADAHYNLAVAYFESGNERLALNEAKILRQLDGKLYEKLVSETRLEQ